MPNAPQLANIETTVEIPKIKTAWSEEGYCGLRSSTTHSLIHLYFSLQVNFELAGNLTRPSKVLTPTEAYGVVFSLLLASFLPAAFICILFR